MAKKKKKKSSGESVKFSPRSYLISGRARKLPIHEVLVESDWKEAGHFTLVIARVHVNNNLTFASFFVDLFCTGIKEVYYGVNIDPEEYQELIEKYRADGMELDTIDYNLAHNILFEALAYSQEWGIVPHPAFGSAQYILAEDDDTIPLIEVKTGFKGKPRLIIDPFEQRAEYYRRQLQTHAEPGTYEIIEEVEDEDDDDYLEEVLDTKGWNHQDWDQYLTNLKLEDLRINPNIIDVIFEKKIQHDNPETVALWRELRGDVGLIEYERVNYDGLEDSEWQFYLENEEKVHNSATSRAELDIILAEVQDRFDANPGNPAFQYLMYLIYNRTRQEEKAFKVLESLIQQYPDHPAAKLKYAGWLMQEKREEEIPDFLQDRYTINRLFPQRQSIYSGEYVDFLIVMCSYYYQTSQLAKAYLYHHLLYDLEIMQMPMHIPTDDLIFEAVYDEVQKVVKETITSIQKDSEFKKQMLDVLVKYDVLEV